MVQELRRWPGVSTLEDLKECLDFSSSAWAALYCQLHGAELVLEVRPASPAHCLLAGPLQRRCNATCRATHAVGPALLVLLVAAAHFAMPCPGLPAP